MELTDLEDLEIELKPRGYYTNMGIPATHYARCDDFEGYFCITPSGKAFTVAKLNGELWNDGYLFNIKDSVIDVKELSQ